MKLLKLREEDTRTSISRMMEEENTLFGLVESERGRSLLLTAARGAEPRTLSRVWEHFQPVVLALVAREETAHLLERLVEESPEIFQLDADLEQVKWMLRTSHCSGLVRAIAASAPDDWLIKMTNWIISDLQDVLLNTTSRGPAVILEELFSKLFSCQCSHMISITISLQAEEVWTGLRKLWRRL